MKRDINFYGAIAEIVAAFAIVASLLFVGFQFRASQTLSAREADISLVEMGQQQMLAIIESDVLADIIVRAETDRELLNEAEELRYLTLQHYFFDSWESGFLYHQDGILTDDAWRDWDVWYARMARSRPPWAWAENRIHYTDPDFRAHVDAAMDMEDAE
ncbi:hypothetical protein V0U79_06125 [Hyphobacterium sp. HN65]|uniref:Uncharacterized protein n=1 Tax=Hyphobacterium lacteum TaxID=3116575 RepID=A0ABU7LPU9_9PROT|nr:hypothetical protein [Hyphobacterium sp. HN65]MEE2525936.1 hypothetical protein [Hyphobacterium sp. HN65]